MTASHDSLQPTSVAVPIVATRSAVIDLAVDIGDELGITPVDFVLGGRFTAHTHLERVVSWKVTDDG